MLNNMSNLRFRKAAESDSEFAYHTKNAAHKERFKKVFGRDDETNSVMGLV
jgi:hypothetical protein